MDVWIAFNSANLQGLVAALREFGFAVPEPAADFLQQGEFVGIGNQPLRIEILTSISGVEFGECYAARTAAQIGELEVSFIGLRQLKINKQASGRFKDLNDISNLPD